MAFSFGFSGDDIDIDDSEINNDFSGVPCQQAMGNSLPELVKANKHEMNEWVSDEPCTILIGPAHQAIAFVIGHSDWPVYPRAFSGTRYCLTASVC